MEINSLSIQSTNSKKDWFYKSASSSGLGRYKGQFNAIIAKDTKTSTTIVWETYKPMTPVAFLEEDLDLTPFNAEELSKLALEAAGIWADRDDITDEWLDELRKGWNTRLDDFTDTTSTNLSI